MRTEDERERGFEAQMRQALRAGAAASPAACVEAEALAAWSEGTLTPAEAGRIEAHAAGCARCGAMLAAFAASAPVDASPAEVVPLWRRWRLQWFVPIAASAAALAVWVAVPRERAATASLPSEASNAAVDMTRSMPAAPAPPAVAAAPPQSETRQFQQPGPSASMVGQAQGFSAGAVREEAAKQEAAAKLDATLAGRAAEVAPPAPAPDRADAAAPAPPPVAAPTAAAAPAVTALRARATTADGPADILSPDPSVRWRALADGRVESSTNGGSTWTPATLEGVQGPVAITNGAAPGPRTCWLVGRGGLVLLSTNGSTFRRIPFPESVDLTSVRSDDATRAMVMAADGRMFETDNGGATWAAR